MFREKGSFSNSALKSNSSDSRSGLGPNFGRSSLLESDPEVSSEDFSSAVSAASEKISSRNSSGGTCTKLISTSLVFSLRVSTGFVQPFFRFDFPKVARIKWLTDPDIMVVGVHNDD